MFLAMVWALPIHYIYDWKVNGNTKKGGLFFIFEHHLLVILNYYIWYNFEYIYIYINYLVTKVPSRIFCILIVPSIFDMAGTTLQNLGLLYIPVSTFQVLLYIYYFTINNLIVYNALM